MRNCIPEHFVIKMGDALMNIGLALGSGGLRGAAHIGVIKVLESAGIKPNMIAGTSAGSVIAAFYASGMSTEQIEKMALNLKKEDILDTTRSTAISLIGPALNLFFGFRKNLPSGIMRGQKLESYLFKKLGKTKMSELKIPCYIVSVDINSGHKIVFSSNKNREFKGTYCYDAYVKDAVRASCSIPGVFMWKKWNNRCLTDGAIREPVPVRTLKEMGADYIIAVDLGHSGSSNLQAIDIIDSVSQAVEIMGEEVAQYLVHNYADVVINPEIFSVPLSATEQISKCIEYGSRAAKKALPEIISGIRRMEIKNNNTKAINM